LEKELAEEVKILQQLKLPGRRENLLHAGLFSEKVNPLQIRKKFPATYTWKPEAVIREPTISVETKGYFENDLT
jgi:hypothetical protein